jgi:hypothetical protein
MTKRHLPGAVTALAVLSTLLAFLGLVRTPSAASGSGVLAFAGVLVAQAACVVASRYGPLSVRRVAPAALAIGVPLGAAVGLLYGLVLVAEYASAAVSRHDVLLGYLIVAALAGAALLAGGLGAHRGRGFRAGLSSALWTAIAEYLVWYPVVLLIHHTYHGTAAETRALRAEGTYDEFARSRMTDFRAFVVQDLFGAGFYHLIADVILALALGSAAAGLTTLARRPRHARA